MTDITRVFNPETRALTKAERRYAGQMGDSLSTILHFEYTDTTFLAGKSPYIIFSVQDEDGNPQVFGRSSEVVFDGYTFPIPWSVTSRMKSNRLEYQLFFIDVDVEYEGTYGELAGLDRTSYILSAVDGIAIKPSIHSKMRGPQCGMPVSPGTEPSVLGWLEYWKQNGLITKYKTELRDNTFICPECPDENGNIHEHEHAKQLILTLYTFSGETMEIPLPVAYLENDKLPVGFIPTGTSAGTVPLLRTDVAKGNLLMSDGEGGFIEYESGQLYEFKGTKEFNEIIALDPATLSPGDVYNSTTAGIFDGEQYPAGTDWVWSVDESGNGRWEPLAGRIDLQPIRDEFEAADQALWNKFTEAMGVLRGDMKVADDKLRKEFTAADETLSAEMKGALNTVEKSLTQYIDNVSGTLDKVAVGLDSLMPRVDKAEEKAKQAIAESMNASAAAELANGTAGEALTTAENALTTANTAIGSSEKATEIATIANTSAQAAVAEAKKKTDIIQAIPIWNAETAYQAGSTVIHEYVLYIALSRPNVGVAPTEDLDAEGNPVWTQIQGNGSGGSGGTTPGFAKTFTYSAKDIEIVHRLGTEDVVYSVRRMSDKRTVTVDATIDSENKLTLRFAEGNTPDNKEYRITVLAAGSTVVTEDPTDTDVTTVENTEGDEVTVIQGLADNEGTAVVQTFNAQGVEVGTAVTQNEGGDTVTTSTYDGELITVSSNDSDTTEYIIGTDVSYSDTIQEGFHIVDFVSPYEYAIVQAYDEKGREVFPNISQDFSAGRVTLAFDDDENIYGFKIVLVRGQAEEVQLTNGIGSFVNPFGRMVLTQVYDKNGEEIGLEVDQYDESTGSYEFITVMGNLPDSRQPITVIVA